MSGLAAAGPEPADRAAPRSPKKIPRCLLEPLQLLLPRFPLRRIALEERGSLLQLVDRDPAPGDFRRITDPAVEARLVL
jgi:hypothetical protein